MRAGHRVLLIAAVLFCGLGVAAPAAAEVHPASLLEHLERAWNGANWPAALAILEQLRTETPDDAGLVDWERRVHLNYGWDLLAAGECLQASEQFEAALALAPGDPAATQGLDLARARCPAAEEQVPVIATLPALAPTSAPGAAPARSAPVSRTTEYIVQPGDTLYGLARRFGVTVEALREVNGLPGEGIIAGTRLLIPPPAQDDRVRTHTVQAGETLYSLARRYGVTVAQLRRANGLRSDVIRTGTVLTIPEATSERTHVVQRGETLYSLARRYGVTVDALVSANGLAGTAIRAGQVLRIPEGALGEADVSGRTHRVVAGETLYGIARRYGTSIQAIQQANDLEGTDIRAGMVLIIP